MNYSSKLLESAVNAFATLPGIGKKTALRLALHLIKQELNFTGDFTQALLSMRQQIKECSQCHNIADMEVCEICRDPRRDQGIICVVESIRDVMAIEETSQYKGLYHVLGGVISPIEGIGPQDLQIDSLLQRVEASEVREIIMAISPTIDGETTIYYITKRLKDGPVKVSTIARGVSFGGDLEYADELTLGRSILSRIPYNVGDK